MPDLPAHLHRVVKAGDPVADVAAPKKLVAGSGVARIWNAFSDPAGRFHVGHWQSEAAVRAVRYTETELCVILEARARLTGSRGATP